MRPGSISPENGLVGWIVNRLVRNYWSRALCAVILAVPAAIGVLAADRGAVAEWLITNDLSPVATAETAKDFLGVATGINAAFLTLSFSITLIVLSLAAGNLGVRLIDRWLDKRLVRVSRAIEAAYEDPAPAWGGQGRTVRAAA